MGNLTFDARRFLALLIKESRQIARDPSTALIAFVLPLLLLFLFGYGVNLDTARTRIGIDQRDQSQEAASLAHDFAASRWFEVVDSQPVATLGRELVAGEIRGMVVIPDGFGRDVAQGGGTIQVITDGGLPNMAGFIAAYAEGVRANWVAQHALEQGQPTTVRPPAITVEHRYWFNPELTSHFFLVPGSIAVVMTMIGTLLTALVVAREWERGTLEALMATPIGMGEFIATKVVPYFLLGLCSMTLCTLLGILVFGVPFRGSALALMMISAVFLLPALGQGLLISAAAKNQFVASQIALLTAFLPTLLLSGFLFEIPSMPAPIRLMTYLVPARYLIPQLQTVFLAGDDWGLFLPDMAALLGFGAIFFAIALKLTPAESGMTNPRLKAIIIKELWAILRDPRTRLILIVPPILQLAIFGLATTLEVKNMSLGVLNRDGGMWSQEVIERVAGSPNVARVMSLQSEGDVRKAIGHQSVIAVLRFDSDFSANVSSGRGGVIGVVADGRRSNAAQIASGYLDQIAAGVGASTSRAAVQPTVFSGSIVVNWFNRNLDYLWFTMPALIAIMSAISAMSVTAQSVARERELGTYDQLMVSPLRVGEILVGKMVPPVLVGAFITTVYVILIPLVFRVPLTGSIALLYAALIFYLLALTGLGMLVSVLSATQQQAFLGMFLMAIPLILLSGYASPVDNMPGWLQVIAHLDPATYFLRVTEGVFLKAMPAGDVLDNCWPLALICLVTLSASALLFRSRME